MRMFLSGILLGYFFMFTWAFAQTVTTVAPPTTLPAIVQAVQTAAATPFTIPAWAYAVMAFFMTDVLPRIIPTKNPQGLFVWAGIFFNSLATICTKIGSIAQNISTGGPTS